MIFIKLGNRTVIVEVEKDRAVFPVDCEAEKVKAFFKKHLHDDTRIMYSSAVYHPREYNLPAGFCIKEWLGAKIGNGTSLIDLIKTEVLSVKYDTSTGKYYIKVKDESMVEFRSPE